VSIKSHQNLDKYSISSQGWTSSKFASIKTLDIFVSGQISRNQAPNLADKKWSAAKLIVIHKCETFLGQSFRLLSHDYWVGQKPEKAAKAQNHSNTKVFVQSHHLSVKTYS
jgi:hypothetical protein